MYLPPRDVPWHRSVPKATVAIDLGGPVRPVLPVLSLAVPARDVLGLAAASVSGRNDDASFGASLLFQ